MLQPPPPVENKAAAADDDCTPANTLASAACTPPSPAAAAGTSAGDADKHTKGHPEEHTTKQQGLDDSQEAVNALRAVVEDLDEAEARTLLQTAGGSVQQAVNLYFDRSTSVARKAHAERLPSAEKAAPAAVSRKRSAVAAQHTSATKRAKRHAAGQASITAFFAKANPAPSDGAQQSTTSSAPPPLADTPLVDRPQAAQQPTSGTSDKAGALTSPQGPAAPLASALLGVCTGAGAAVQGAADAVMLPLAKYDPVRWVEVDDVFNGSRRCGR